MDVSLCFVRVHQETILRVPLRSLRIDVSKEHDLVTFLSVFGKKILFHMIWAYDNVRLETRGVHAHPELVFLDLLIAD